ncbi:MAG TPA: metallophosphoesterase [Gemmatimonadota bacterium]|nr:metallophosphoesterase [Gemmatimonadota bacterium]
MTRILHTADLHLADGHPERWEALEAVVAAASQREADALLVAGDLLDRGSDHAALRPRIRAAFEAFAGEVFLLPGNHDLSAYRPGQDWGPRTHLLVGAPVVEARTGGVRLVGVPFPAEPIRFSRLRQELAERLEGEAPAVLVLHGTLIDAAAPEILDESRADEPGPYFPVRTEELRGLGAAYVALGHHHQHAERPVGGGAVAAYAGSPSPVGSHARGPRRAVLLEVGADGSGGPGGAAVRPVRLPVPYRERRERWLDPFEEESGLEALERELEEAADPACSMRVRVDGILAGMTEAAVRTRVEALAERLGPSYAELAFDLEGVGLDPARADLFRDFSRRLDERLEAAAQEGEPIDAGVGRRALELAARALKT